ncbi:MAG: orotate phosphoribosyltransferase [Bacteriovoracia bacterium]
MPTPLKPSKNTSHLKSQLIELIRRRSYREGDFTLASGQKSTFYIDLKPTTLHPEGAYLLGQLAVARVQELGLPVEAVGGLTLGADPIATAVSLAAREAGLEWPAFIVRKEAKAHGTSKFIEGTENLREGMPVLVLEDVVTTGGSSVKAIERLREAGYRPTAVLTIVDREQGGAEKFRELGLQLIALATISEVRNHR